jgi:dUTP pyrophosphatase
MILSGNIGDLYYATTGSAAVDLRSRVNCSLQPTFQTRILADLVNIIRGADSLFEIQQALTIHLENQMYSNGPVVIPTGVYVEEAHATEHVFIVPRSGLALRYSITVFNTPGLVDADYPEEIGVILINHGVEPFQIKVGDRIAQMILMGHHKFRNIPAKDETRTGGFGSTGVK